MSLRDTYIANLTNCRRSNPDAEFIQVTRSSNHILSPSWPLLNAYHEKRITWDEYILRFTAEMKQSKCVEEMRRIKALAEKKDVFLVCFEKVGHCHRFLLVDMIKEMNLKPKFCTDCGTRIDDDGKCSRC